MFISQAYTSRTYEGEHLRQAEINCPYHSGQPCMNYCIEKECLKILCSQCIEEHLHHHKKTGLSDLSIKSMKRVREFCVDKLNKLMEELFSKSSLMKQPRSPHEMIEQTRTKLEAIKRTMYDIIEEEFLKFNEQIKIRVTQSANSINRLGEIHEKLNKIINQLKQCKFSVIQGSKELPQTIHKVLQLDTSTYVNLFSKESAAYAQELSTIDFQIALNEGAFRKTVSQVLQIHNSEMGFQIINHTLPISRTPRSQKKPQSFNLQFPKLLHDSDVKKLHFFQAGQSNLHIYSFQKGMYKNTIQLQSFITPDFHATLMTSTGFIFTSGGILQLGEKSQKTKVLCRYSLKTSTFKEKFAKVYPRSSHSICEHGDYIYILGGYGAQNYKHQTQIQNKVQRINMKKGGDITEEEPSNWGGANFSVVMNGRIVKASSEGVEAYDLTKKIWKMLHVPDNFEMHHGCGWSKLSEEHLLVYGGYGSNTRGIDTCELWLITDNQVLIKEQDRLPKGEGFSNSPGIIMGGCLYVLQNMSENDETEESYLIENERNVLCFDGERWREMQSQ